MPSFLAEELEQLRRRVSGDEWKRDHEWAKLAADVTEMVALALHLLDRIESAAAKEQPVDRWDESAARRFIPLFRQWFDYATAVNEARRASEEHGYAVDDSARFLHALNRAKMMARDFDSLVESQRRIERGESGGRPLREVMDELRGRSGARGGG
jgi:hypothetical protein